MVNIVHKLDKIREAKSLDKSALAQKIGVSRETVYNWRDNNIKVDTFLKVCKILDTDPRVFFDDFDTKTVSEPLPTYKKTVKNCDEITIERDILKSQNEIHATSISALKIAIEALQIQLKQAVKHK